MKTNTAEQRVTEPASRRRAPVRETTFTFGVLKQHAHLHADDAGRDDRVQVHVEVQPEGTHPDDCEPGVDLVPVGLALEVHRAAGLDGEGAEALALCAALGALEFTTAQMQHLELVYPELARLVLKAGDLASEAGL